MSGAFKRYYKHIDSIEKELKCLIKAKELLDMVYIGVICKRNDYKIPQDLVIKFNKYYDTDNGE